MSDDVYMSDELIGRVDLGNQSDLSKIEKNTTIIVVQHLGERDVLIGGMRYFRHESSETSIEMHSSLDSIVKTMQIIEDGNREISLIELHRGDDRILCLENLFITGYYVSEVDPVSAHALFGLKTSEKIQVL